jgi:hypothetical protein
MPTSIASRPKAANLPFDEFLASPHFLKQRRIADNPGCVLDLPARFVQPCYDPHDRSLHDVCQVRDAVEAHAPGPLVNHLNHTKPRLADKVVGIVGREDDLVQRLDLIYFFGYLDNSSDATFETSC